MKSEYPGFRTGRYEWEAECITCGSSTFISVANKGELDLKAEAYQECSRRIFIRESH